MNKRILLIGGNFLPEPTGIGKYNGEMIDWLSTKGFSCTVITTFPYYPYWKIQEPFNESCYWYKKEVRTAAPGSQPINIIRCPHYVPKNPSGLKRIISDFSFFFTVYLLVLCFLFKPKYDYVLTVVPPFQLGLLALLYKKIKGAKVLYHIQDLQIDAARDLQMIKSDLIIKVLFSIEKYIIRNADYVSTISAGMIKKVKEKCNRDIVYFPNWVDSNCFFPLSNKGQLKSQFGFSPTDKIVLYSGAIGEKQGLEAILFSAQALGNLPNLKFIICGSGPYKEKLFDLSNKLGLKNVTFLNLQPKNKFNQFLNIADLHLILQKANASDLVMPSKLTTILSVGGLALITANKGTSLHELVTKLKIGIVIEPENQEALNMAIKRAIIDESLFIINNARNYVETHLHIDKVIEKFSEVVFGTSDEHEHAGETLKIVQKIKI